MDLIFSLSFSLLALCYVHLASCAIIGLLANYEVEYYLLDFIMLFSVLGYWNLTCKFRLSNIIYLLGHHLSLMYDQRTLPYIQCM